MSRFVFFLTCLIGACSPTHPSVKAPSGFGSTSLCADSYLIALAPERIEALSWQAGTPLSTASPDMKNLPKLWESRELMASSKLTLLTGPSGQPSGEKRLALQWGEDFETVRTNLEAIQAQFGLDVSDTITAIDALSALPKPSQPPRILYLSRAGGSAGAGTFVDAVIKVAGGQNIVQRPGWHTPTLEQVLQYEPDLIITSFFGSDYSGANDRAVRHTALNRYLDQYPRLDLPGKLWPCAGPGLIEATHQLNQALLAL